MGAEGLTAAGEMLKTTAAGTVRTSESGSGYYGYCREDLLAHVPPSRSARLLELGASGGNTLLEAKKRGIAGTVVGIDSVDVAGSNQRHPSIDRFIIADLADPSITFEPGWFDAIICGDVLEHLADPWQTLERYGTFLRDGGLVIASMPNVRYWKVSLGLVVAGKWDYRDAGILDRTHLRFFVRDSMLQLFEQAGFAVRTVERLGPQRNVNFPAWLFDKLTFGFFSDLLTVQYIIVASRSRRKGS